MQTWSAKVIVRGPASWGCLALLAMIAPAPPGAAGPTKSLRTIVVSGRQYPLVDSQGRTRMVPDLAVDGRLVVTLRRGAGVADVRKAARRLGGTVSKVFLRSRVAVIELPPGMSVLEAQARAGGDPALEGAEPDRLVYARQGPVRSQLTPNDPLLGQQAHLNRTHVREAWDVTTGSAATIVAVIDAGLDMDHPEFVGKVFTNTAELANGIDDDGNGYVDDLQGWDFLEGDNNPNPTPNGIDDNSDGTVDENVSHGTLVSGTILARGNNSAGGAGLDWHAKVMPLKVLPDDQLGTTVSMVLAAIDYANDMGAHVINLSVGGPYSSAWDPALEAASAAGILVVVAGGNSSRIFTNSQGSWESPVCNDGPQLGADNWVVGVASVNSSDVRSVWSNTDSSDYSFIDIAAPGEDVFGPYSNVPGWPEHQEWYGSRSGTSFAAPVVSGAACLLLAQFPAATPDFLIGRMTTNADNIDRFNPGFAGGFGGGRLNVARALGLDLPPGPATGLAAQDTPDDDGGSIDLTWTPSFDDQSGANDVTAYGVLRSTATGGPFTVVTDDLPPGTGLYQDSPVPNGTVFYYKVRTYDGSTSVGSSISGPASASDDSPPPPVTTLTARDRPMDSGGAIELGWDGYSPPADFLEYRLYRRETSFSTVSGKTPIVIFTDPATIAHVDAGTIDGQGYYYALTGVDTSGNEEKSVTTVGPVRSFPNEPHIFPPGVSLAAVPAVDPMTRDPAAYLGVLPSELTYARYDPATEAYRLYQDNPSDPFLQLALGRGFFLGLAAELPVTPQGDPSPAADLAVLVNEGWHLFGNPYFHVFDFAGSTVHYQSTAYTLHAADASGLIQAAAWTYDQGDGSYRLVSDLYPGGAQGVHPWHGFWVFGRATVSLFLSHFKINPTSAAAPRQATGDSWVLKLGARLSDCADVDNFLGIHAAAAQAGPLLNPPPVNDVDLYFPGATPGQRVAGSYRASLAAGATWDFEVACRRPDAEVTVEYPDLSPVPRDLRPVLVDRATGETVYMRTTRSYRYRSGAGAGARKFAITFEPDTGGGLTVTGLSAQGTRGGGAEVRFVLSRAASCEIEVLNIAGRRVALLETARVRAGGPQTALWDGRSATGTPVPSGRYLLRIEAAADDGEMAAVVTSVALRR